MTNFENMQPEQGDAMQRQNLNRARPVAEAKTSGMAITALILGIVGWISCGITAIPGLILGIVAMNQIKDPSRGLKGSGMAMTGTVLSGIALVLPVLALLVAILLPALGAARITARKMTNSTQIRGIHQSMVTYAQGNKSWYPGVNHQGIMPQPVSDRFKILLDAQYFTPDYLINLEDNLSPASPGPQGYVVTPANYSYALLSIMPENSGRRAEWKDSLNSEAVVISDRNTNTGGQPESVWDGPGQPWTGTVSFNDGSVMFERSDVLSRTRYGQHMNRDDELFAAPTSHDALMIHSGR